MTQPTGPHDPASSTPGKSYGPGKEKEPPEAGKVSTVETTSVTKEPPGTPRGLPGEDALS